MQESNTESPIIVEPLIVALPLSVIDVVVKFPIVRLVEPVSVSCFEANEVAKPTTDDCGIVAEVIEAPLITGGELNCLIPLIT